MFRSFADIIKSVSSIPGPDPTTLDRVLQAWDTRTKPPGSLGRLEQIAAWVASVQRRETGPVCDWMSLRLFAAAHGITQEKVSACPDSINQQMLRNFHQGGAAINAICRSNQIDFRALDAGVDMPTANFLYAPAMSEDETVSAFSLGWESVPALSDLFAVGEMGIGNTTASAAIIATITGTPVDAITGRGAGLSDEALAHKTSVLKSALINRAPELTSPLAILASIGGREIAAMTGAILSSAFRKIPVVLDGAIAAAAAAIAFEIQPNSRGCCIAGHRSSEPAHDTFLRHYGLEPVLDLGMRLGEGSGAAVAMGVVRNAVDAFRQMATFEEAGVVLP